MIPNGPLQSVLKHGVNRLSQRAGDGGKSDAGFPDLENRNLSQIWAFENKESAIKVRSSRKNLLRNLFEFSILFYKV